MDVPVYMNMCIHIMFFYKKLSEWLQHLYDELGDLLRMYVHVYGFIHLCDCSFMYIDI
jgi:hypothetical protein